MMNKVKLAICEVYDVVKTALALFVIIFLSAIVISMPVLMLQAAVMWADGGF